jgi:hypothetical protein
MSLEEDIGGWASLWVGSMKLETWWDQVLSGSSFLKGGGGVGEQEPCVFHFG